MRKPNRSGFLFIPVDWMTDAELRFCSMLARGLLIELMCLLDGAIDRGYANKPDGTPRSDEEIISAISGASQEEKLAALKELEASGVLLRTENGVLFCPLLLTEGV